MTFIWLFVPSANKSSATFSRTVSQLQDLVQWLRGYDVETIELSVQFAFKHDRVVKLLVSFDGGAGCKVILKPNGKRQHDTSNSVSTAAKSQPSQDIPPPPNPKSQTHTEVKKQEKAIERVSADLNVDQSKKDNSTAKKNLRTFNDWCKTVPADLKQKTRRGDESNKPLLNQDQINQIIFKLSFMKAYTWVTE